jgi:hypothetical protein
MKNAEKHIQNPITDSCLVMPKGATKGIMGGALVGAVAGSAGKAANDQVAAMRSGAPLAGGTASLGLLALTDDEIVLLDGRRGMVRPVATGLAGSVQRSALVDAELGTGRLSSPLRLSFEDGSSWQLEVPRKYVKDARRLLEAARG